MIVIVDYGLGNLGSILNMLKKIGADVVISGEQAAVESADKLVLPGVGAFDNGMRNLEERGLVQVLRKKVVEQKTPILGLCLGMQLFSKGSEEGKLSGLGWIDAQVVRFKFASPDLRLKVPHMGWNTVEVKQANPVFADLDDQARFYFVHSYHIVCADVSLTLAESEYGYRFTSAVVKDNIFGVQFHPEKSHKFGLKLFDNFSKLNK